MDGIIADILIIVSTLALLATVGVTAYSVIRSQRTNKRPKEENKVRVRMIGLSVVCLILAVSLPTLLFGSLTDMCIITSIVMLCIASIAVIYGRIQTVKLRKHV